MPTPTFIDTGTYNLKDIDTGNLVAKVHIEPAATDAAGGRSYVMHWALVKSSLGVSGWGVWAMPTTSNNKQWKWEGASETLTQFIAWMNDADRRGHLRYVMQSVREQDVVPAPP